jgi:shikimate dehydrogenase
MRISATTSVCAVIGDPVEHSLSPAIHNAAFDYRDLNMVYAAFHVKNGDLERALAGVRSLGIRGLSVTIPHKVDILPFLDSIEPLARRIGSVNTVTNRDGRLNGSSTDGPGALRALEAQGVDAPGKRVLLLGSGGAARAIAFALADLSPAPRLQILGIEEDELSKLAEDLQGNSKASVEWGPLDRERIEAGVDGAEIVVHATPVGMAPKTDASLIPEGMLRPDQVVFDAVYIPFETRLLRIAREAGARTVPGLGMFVHQAAIQFELWTGTDAPIDVMSDAVRRALTGRLT